MLTVGTHLFIISLWAGVFWTAIWLVDRRNPKNTFALALGLALVFDFTHAFGVPDLYMGIAWIVFLARLVTWHYNLMLLQTLLVCVAAVFGPMFVLTQLIKWVGDSPFRDALAFYGLPVVVFGAWGFGYVRDRLSRPAMVDEMGVPAARVEKLKRADTQPTPAASSPEPVPVPVRVAVAPPAPAPARDGNDGPSMLS